MKTADELLIDHAARVNAAYGNKKGDIMRTLKIGDQGYIVQNGMIRRVTIEEIKKTRVLVAWDIGLDRGGKSTRRTRLVRISRATHPQRWLYFGCNSELYLGGLGEPFFNVKSMGAQALRDYYKKERGSAVELYGSRYPSPDNMNNRDLGPAGWSRREGDQ